MKLLIGIFFFCIISPAAFAQDSAWVLGESGLSSKSGKIDFREDKWIFKKGNDPDWARTDLDTKSWEKIAPGKLDAAYADDKGRVEGWFRIKIRIDSSISGMPLRLYSRAWAASDIYVDGKLIHSFGNTGSKGQPFKEYNPYQYQTVSLPSVAGKEYVLAWHFVDDISPFGGKMLKSSQFSPDEWLFASSIKFENYFYGNMITSRTYDGILISVTVVLSLLFWLIAFLTPKEKDLKWIATGSSLLALLSITVALSRVEIFSFLPNAISGMISTFVIAVIFLFNPVILAKIFHRKIHKGIRFTLIICMAIFILFFLYSMVFGDLQNSYLLFGVVSVAVPLLLSLYYVFSSWKNLHGAQWAIVIGFLISVLSLAAYIAGSMTGFFTTYGINYMILVMFYTLSPPLGMLVYVSFRFKEILQEVRINSEQVLHLSEEKRQQALNQQKVLEEEVERQTADLKNTLANLKSTQAQLIQSEKMASLGELTAGIAHEIQNPLNFVNNFSDVNKELVDEAAEEIDKGNLSEAKDILKDVKDNSEKINHHGKRADAIVKGMLQHSRSSGGQKELTDINALCDEYLRLSYHGLRAKDPRDAAHKNFNVTLKTDFDPSIGKITIIPQDIGRVIMNLLTNAFYTVNEKKKLAGSDDYEAIVSVETTKTKDKVRIRISDNGNGIPDAVKEKIFQPFFTTKPTGQGTGLGLSLSYDIIKAHGGELEMETKEKEGTSFIILLPNLIITK